MNKSLQLGTILTMVLALGMVQEGWARGFGGHAGGIPGGGRIPGGFRGGLNLGQLHNVAATGQLNQNPGGADWTQRAARFVPRGTGPSPFRTPQGNVGVPSTTSRSSAMPRYTAPARPNTSSLLINPALGGLANTGATLSSTAARPSIPPTMPASPYSNYSLPSDAGLHALSGFGK